MNWTNAENASPGRAPSVLVTGGTGFIGDRLVKALASAGHAVLSLSRRASAPARPCVVVLECDLGDAESVRTQAPRFRDVDAVVHLAAFSLPSARAEADELERCVRDNMLATANLLPALVPPPAWMAYASTTDVYGPPRAGTRREGEAAAPHTFYAASKLAAEALVQAWGARAAVPCAILRFAQVYGPGDPSQKVIPTFLRNARGGRPLVLTAGGSARRAHLHVDDAVRAIRLAMDRRAHGTFNIVGPEAVTVRALADEVRRVTGLAVPVEVQAGEAEAPASLDGEKARREFGFAPEIGLARGLRDTWEWMRDHA